MANKKIKPNKMYSHGKAKTAGRKTKIDTHKNFMFWLLNMFLKINKFF